MQRSKTTFTYSSRSPRCFRDLHGKESGPRAYRPSFGPSCVVVRVEGKERQIGRRMVSGRVLHRFRVEVHQSESNGNRSYPTASYMTWSRSTLLPTYLVRVISSSFGCFLPMVDCCLLLLVTVEAAWSMLFPVVSLEIKNEGSKKSLLQKF